MAKAKKSETQSESAETPKPSAPKAAKKAASAAKPEAPAAKSAAPAAKSAAPATKASAPAAKAPAGAAKKPAAKPSKAGSTPGGTPMVDTQLAAQAAVNMLLNRSNAAPVSGTPQKESGAFKQMKDALNKPTLSGLVGGSGPTGMPKSNLPHAMQKQKGHNQTFGADVNRSGVPRRTPG